MVVEFYYVFGRYPADLSPYADQTNGRKQYPVVDLVICHGDFLKCRPRVCTQKQKREGFRHLRRHHDPGPENVCCTNPLCSDRRYYRNLMTLIAPRDISRDPRFTAVGDLTRIESEGLVVGYTFDFRTNDLKAEKVPNPRAGTEHQFTAYRLNTQAHKPVSMLSRAVILKTIKAMGEE